MPSLKTKNLKQEYSSLLERKPDITLATYRGLSVNDITDLRKKLKEKGSALRIIKNNVFKIALKEYFGDLSNDFDKNFQGPLGVVFTKGELPGITKVLRDYGKENENVQLVCGFMESSYCSKKELEAISNLPSRDEVLATLVASLNSSATKIASGLSQVIASLARGVQAVAEKNASK